MKRAIVPSILLFAHLSMSAQNHISNPSFELVSGTNPHSFFEGEVQDWFAIGNASEVMDEYLCHPVTYLAQDQTFFADLIAGHAIVNKLAVPILPYQKLNVNFWGLVSDCAWDSGYLVEFYLSNTATNTSSTFPFFPNPNTYLKVGQRYINQGNENWTNYSATLQATPWFNNIPCEYKYLVVVIKKLMMGGQGEVTERVPTDFALLDNFQLTSCQSNLTSTILYNIDNDGICSKVLFTAQCSNTSGFYYIWDFGDGTCQATSSMDTEHTYSALGSYDVKLTIVDNEGCITQTTETINVKCKRCEGIQADFSASCIECFPLYVGDPQTQTTTLVGYSCRYNMTDLSVPSDGSNVVSWKWTQGSSVLSTAQNPTLTLTATSFGLSLPVFKTTLCLEIQDANGCNDKICKEFRLPCREEGRESEKGEAVIDEISIYPNPSQGLVTLVLPTKADLKSAHLDIFDIRGQLVKQVNLPEGETQLSLDLNWLNDGMYIFSVKADGFLQQKKVVFQH